MSLEEVSCKAEEGSVVLIHFSGHGYELPDECDQGLIPTTLTKEMVLKIFGNNLHVFNLLTK